MAFSDVAALSNDGDFLMRVAACVAIEDSITDGTMPNEWATAHRWDMAATPGFGDAYASALASGVERPGNDPGVITDPQILSAVQTQFV